MNMLKLGAVVVTGVIFVAGANVTAFAASPITEAYLTNLVPNVDFLDRSSRFALTNSKNAHLRDYAHSAAKEQTLAANALDEWIEADKAPGALADADGVKTGRSVAVDGQAPQTGPAVQSAQAAPAAVADMRLHMGQEDLDSLEGLEGAEFDDLYKTKQRDALSQIQTDYEDYIVKGDDPALKAMATSELPKIKHRLSALGKM